MANSKEFSDVGPSKLGEAFSDAIFDLVIRYRLIKDNTNQFAKLIYFQDLGLAIGDLQRQKSIILSIPSESDDELLEKIDSEIERYTEISTKFLQDHFPETVDQVKTAGGIKSTKYSHKMDDFVFYFDPSILPSTSSRSGWHNPMYPLNSFLRNQLIGLVTEFELFLSKIFRGYYVNYEGSLENKEVSIKLEDIKKFGDLNDIKEQVIENEIYQLTQGGIEEWKKFLLDKFGIKMTELYPNFDQFKEIFMRRNLFVHNDGIVNKRYLASNKSSIYKLGDTAEISEEYIRTSLEVLKIFAISICFMGWHHLMKEKDKEFLATSLSDIGYDAMKNDEWYVAERVYHHLSKYGDEEDKLIAKINNILCLKNTQRSDKAEEALGSVNYSMYNAKYIIGFAALKEDIQAFIENAKLSELSAGSLLDWPILRGIQNHPDFKQFLKERMFAETIVTASREILEKMSKTRLVEVASSQGLTPPSSFTKAQIVDAIVKHQERILES